MLDQYFEERRLNKFLRALAINIVEDTGKSMTNASKNLIEIPSDDQWKDDLQEVILSGNMIQTIPNGTCPRCSLLSALFLDDNEMLNYISDDFFNNMPALKILDLSWTRIKCLPESVSSLKYLNALLLLGCIELSYIPPLRNLKWLILLDLYSTAITEVPLGLESLINLKGLNLLRIPNLVISTSLISNLINLECLELDVSELVHTQGLRNLEVIVADFHDIDVFNTYISLLHEHPVLRSYHLTLQNSIFDCDYEGINTEYSMKRITVEEMDLRNRKAVLPGDIKELVMYRCRLLGAIDSCICSVVLSYGHNNNNDPHQMERLDIISCKDVKSFCCLSSLFPFCSSSQLVGRLHLENLEDLKDIVSPYALLSLRQPSLFSHLTDLQIRFCHNMETLMTPKLLDLFQNLRTISISHCLKIKEIVGEDDHSKIEPGGSGDLSPPTPITLPRLTSLKLLRVPQLNFVYRGVMLCPFLQTFSACKCEKLNRPRIEISNGCELPMVNTSTGYGWEITTD
ncbi:hypothetical protein K1719_022999 [Acacia pycnantha]|nr:hypothetical protein K1719_022999 [Acacia pycnantha]